MKLAFCSEICSDFWEVNIRKAFVFLVIFQEEH